MTTPTPADIELPALPQPDEFACVNGVAQDIWTADTVRAAILADRARTAASCAGWVSVDERLPALPEDAEDDGVQVYTWDGDFVSEDQFMPEYEQPAGPAVGGWLRTGEWFSCDNLHRVTHWMPRRFPAAPGAPATARAERTDATTVAQPSDTQWDQALRERDSYHEWADKLAEKIEYFTGVDIGEHSSANNPWRKALDAAAPEGCTPADARVLREANHALAVDVQQMREALQEIALAGMSGTGQESDEAMRAWHARRAREFIGIAARALEPAPTAGEAGGADHG